MRKLFISSHKNVLYVYEFRMNINLNQVEKNEYIMDFLFFCSIFLSRKSPTMTNLSLKKN